MAERLPKRELIKILETDDRVREWLAGGKDPDAESVGALLSSNEAAEFCGVERTRIWRWERTGKLKRALTTTATPLYLRVDLLPLKAEVEELRARRGRVRVAAAERSGQ